jgi:hypothetical protein
MGANNTTLAQKSADIAITKSLVKRTVRYIWNRRNSIQICFAFRGSGVRVPSAPHDSGDPPCERKSL